MLSEELRLKHHFWMILDDRRYSYVNIRKNACSTFRRFFRKQSGFKPKKEQMGNFEFIRMYHAENNVDDIKNSDFKILIARDPFDRICSIYSNKFDLCINNKDIFSSYYAVTGLDPQNASINDFVTRYIGGNQSLDNLDPHVWPQQYHVFEIEYNAAMLMNNIHAGAIQLFGEPLASEYFGVKINSSGESGKFRAALDSDAVAVIREKYAADFVLCARIADDTDPIGNGPIRAVKFPIVG